MSAPSSNSNTVVINENETGRKPPKLIWVLTVLLIVMGLRTTRIDQLPSFELPTEQSMTAYFTNYSVDFSSWYAADGAEEQLTDKEREASHGPASRLSLDDLMAIVTASSSSSSCQEGTYYVHPTKKVKQPTDSNQQKIPKIIHQLDISLCLPRNMVEATQQWKNISGFQYYLHTNESLHAFIDQEWPEFPHLRSISRCMSNYRGYVDIWKALTLWEFGGAVAEFDLKPIAHAFASILIDTNDEAIVFADESGYPTPFSFLMEPKHPLAYYMVMTSLNTVNVQQSMLGMDWEKEMGGDVFKNAWWYFVGFDMWKFNPPRSGYGKWDKVHDGRYKRTAKYVAKSHNFVVPGDVAPNWRATHYPNVTGDALAYWNRTCIGITHDYLANAATPSTAVASVLRGG